MSVGDFKLDEDDPVLKRYRGGLRAWERSPAPGAGVKPGVGAAGAGAVSGRRTRGAVRTRGRATPHRAEGAASFALPDDDPVVRTFKEGLSDWEDRS